jgi:hypothetical protein
MKRKSSSLRPLLPVATLGILSVGAQTFTPTKLVPVPSESVNQLAASFRMAFNVKTSFENVGAFASGASQATPDGDAWNYDDGYVLTDSSGNAMGYTRYWGYSSSGQLPGDGTILMHRYSSGGSTVGANPDEPLPGFELRYRRELGRGEKMRWGLEAAGNYMRVSVRDSGTIASSAFSLTDAYALPALEGGGYVSPPPAPYYHGSGLSPQGNPVIGATPVSSLTDTMMASVSGSRDFEANVIGWRLGPYVEMPLGQKGKLSLSGGLSLAYVLSDFNFTESIASPIATSASGGGSDSELLVGAYISGEASYQLAQAWEVFGSVQFQYLDKYSQTESGRTAVLDMTKSLFVAVGVSYSF